MGNIIERTNYKTLDNAINIKNELVKDLKENFGKFYFIIFFFFHFLH
jgi:hypothetical protein